MGWEHAIAGMLNEGAKPAEPSYFVGNVLSPIKYVDPQTEAVSYRGPLIISCFGGEVILKRDRLCQIVQPATESTEPMHDGDVVALLGSPFSKAPGSQKVLILGVITGVV